MDSDGDTVFHPDKHSYANRYGDTDLYTDSDQYAERNVNPNRNAVRDSDIHGDRDGHSDTAADRHTDTGGYPHRHAHNTAPIVLGADGEASAFGSGFRHDRSALSGSRR